MKKFLALLCVSIFLFSGVAAADTFPSREIKMIIPFSAGGATDIMARKLQPIMMDKFGVNLVVLNKEGGNSAVGLTELITAPADGYTVAIASSTILILMGQGQVKWGIEKFTNISLLSEEPMLLLVKNDAPWKTLDEFMNYVKENPGKIRAGTAAGKSVNHAMAISAGRSIDSEITHVPFKGASLALPALMGGHVECCVLKPSDSMAQIRAGEVRPLGIFRNSRIDPLPDVPTFEEKGYDVFPYGPVDQISFIVAPAGISEEVRGKLTDMFKEAVLSTQFQEYGKSAGFVSQPVTGKEFDDYLAKLSSALKEVAEKIF